jgi:DNA (cytosine-5)-methyltransferase 1
MKILNLYAGIGGNRKLWENVEVTAVELNPEIAAIYKDFFPNDTVIVGDAHQYLLDHYKEFDFIWSSPPCPSHSRTNTFLNKQGVIRYPDMGLYQEIIFLKQWFKGLWCVENVIPYYKPLIEPTVLLGRHLIWSNFSISKLNKKETLLFTPSKDNYLKLQEYHMVDLSKYKKIYMGKNHCYLQILRNCVHYSYGLHILNCALNYQVKNNTIQTELF